MERVVSTLGAEIAATSSQPANTVIHDTLSGGRHPPTLL